MKLEDGIILVAIGYLIGNNGKKKIPLNTKCTACTKPATSKKRSLSNSSGGNPTSTRTEVRSPTSTTTDAYTRGNITVTGGSGEGATTVNLPDGFFLPQLQGKNYGRTW